MTNGEDLPVTRREFDTLARTVERIDEHGTRGIGVLQQQITDLIKDVVELQSSTNSRFGEHARQHEREHQERVTGRRWLISLGVAGVAALGGLYPLILVAVHH